MGAQIKLIQPRTYQIVGSNALRGAIYKIMPDRNEAVSYACAAVATRGDVIVENAIAGDLTAFLEQLELIGGKYSIGDYGIRFYYEQELRARAVTTTIHPGFMTDWQPLWATLAAHARGESTIHETVMQSRLQYVEPLQAMGVKIKFYQPQVTKWEATYNFNRTDEIEPSPHAIKITGPTQWRGGKFAVTDLRAGATLLLAALSSKEQTVLDHVEQIDRGYEQFDVRLRQLGAKIKRIK
jgi:UDP-N-acetylglucosamine 1-carboxyvinyltransferase